MSGTREVFVEGQADVTIDADDLYGDVQITGGAISGTFSVTVDVSENLEWQYDEEDITDMLDDQGGDLDSLWEWLDAQGVKVWAEFLKHLIDNESLDREDTIILRDILIEHLMVDAMKQGEKDATKV
tara:strand:- start:18 stop:398 length:381 start_codon:yes stop_codon:yes gene_type:complete